MKQIKVNIEKCTGCGQCVLACAFDNVGRYELEQSNIRILQWEDICLSVPHLCQQCKDTPCVSACPVDAIFVNPDTGAIVIDKEQCVQCNACVEECRYQVIHIDPDGFPLTCDLCDGNPKCVAVCFPGALTYGEIPEEEREPLKPLVQLLIDKAAGKNVVAPVKLKSKSVT